MYVVVVVLSIAGNQVPEIGVVFVELVGKANVPPTHIAATCAKVGVTGSLTVMVIVSSQPRLLV